MLLLVYVLVSLYMSLISLSFPVYEKVSYLTSIRAIPNYQDLILLTAYSLNLLLSLTITLFFKFHVKLVLTNSTTIDNMDKKNIQKTNSYDKGSTMNWYQVFGRNKWLWLLPITGISGKPIGDGVIWTQENGNMDEEIPENEIEIRKSVPETGNVPHSINNDNLKLNLNSNLGFSSSDKTLSDGLRKENETKPSDSQRKRK